MMSGAERSLILSEKGGNKHAFAKNRRLYN
jgi:hypothetical protein